MSREFDFINQIEEDINLSLMSLELSHVCSLKLKHLKLTTSLKEVQPKYRQKDLHNFVTTCSVLQNLLCKSTLGDF